MKLTQKEQAKLDRKTAAHVVKLFDEKIKVVQNQASDGDRGAAIAFMELITAKGWALRRLGLMVNDTGRLVKFKPWDGKS